MHRDPIEYNIQGDNIVYLNPDDPEYNPPGIHGHHINPNNDPTVDPNTNIQNHNNTLIYEDSYYPIDVFITLAIFTFATVQLIKCYTNFKEYIYNQRNQLRRPLNNIDINSLNTLVVCDELPDNTCSVCLDEFKDEDVLVKLNCEHIFHKDCLEPWLNNNRNCPLCRQNIV